MTGIRRIWWQITGLILINFPFYGRLAVAWLPVPALNCYACPLAQGACPIGTIQHFLVIGSIPFFALGIVGLFGIVAGRFYCSHICPFGFLQDVLAKITKKTYRLPRWIEYGKYAVLVIFVLILPPILKEPFFCTLCPAGSLEAGIPIVVAEWFRARTAPPSLFGMDTGILGMIGWWFWFKIGLLAAVLITAVFTRRPFCRAICPLGALFGLFNRLSLMVHPPTAGKPRYYLKNCPVHINHPDDVDSPACIKCRECYVYPRNKENNSGKTVHAG